MIQLTDTELFKLSTALEVPYETLQKLYSMQTLHEPTVFNVLIRMITSALQGSMYKSSIVSLV